MRTEMAGLSIALRALLAHQQALETTGHNIANANSEGYSRQVVRLQASQPQSFPAVRGQLGSGVETGFVERIRSAFFDQQIRTQNHTLARWETVEQFLRQVELVYGEPSENGISGALARFWNAWREVSSAPEASSARRALIARAQDLAAMLNTVASNFVALQRDADRRIRFRVDDINGIAEKIAVLNDRIARVLALGDQANDLRDQRDALLTKLSKLVDFVTTEDRTGAVTVTIGGRNLVTATTSDRVGVQNDPLNNNFLQIVWQPDGTPMTLRDGELQGLLTARDTHLASQLSDLNALASALVTTVNTQHALGFGLPPGNATGNSFFTPTGTTAATIAVSSTIPNDPNAVAAAAAANQPGDGSNALAIANLQSSAVLSGNTQTIDEFFTGMITKLGADTQQATLAQESQELLVEHMERQQEEQAGVNLDEEAVRLLRFQRAYQAAARYLTVTDELIDLIVNRLGVGGR